MIITWRLRYPRTICLESCESRYCDGYTIWCLRYSAAGGLSQQPRDVVPMLCYTLIQQWLNVSCLMGCSKIVCASRQFLIPCPTKLGPSVLTSPQMSGHLSDPSGPFWSAFRFKSRSWKPIASFLIYRTHTSLSRCRCAFWCLWNLTYLNIWPWLTLICLISVQLCQIARPLI